MAWVPERGELVWISLDPQLGHEQQGRRPVLVLTPSAYNRLVGLFVVCPVTSKSKGYPFEVPITGAGDVKGVALADRLKSLDWRARRAELIGKAGPGVVEECAAKAVALIEGS